MAVSLESRTPDTPAKGNRGISWTEARAVAASAVRPLPAADVPLGRAGGRRLAVPLRALVALPGADVAAMDGYAVAGAPPWRVRGRVLAGEAPFPGPLGPGEAVEIATGAPVPAGTAAVLPYESADVRAGRGGASQVRGPADKGRHVRRRGEDVAEGAAVLGAGSLLTPAALGLAAALGHDTLPVRPAPEVAVLVTGDEVEHAGLPGPGRVRDAIGPFLPGLVEWAGGRARPPVRLPDDAAALRAALEAGARGRTPAASEERTAERESGAARKGKGRTDDREPVRGTPVGEPGGPPAAARAADVIVVCGASSAGPADHLRGALAEVGAEILVDGVAVRPGHPQLLARLPDGRTVVGLPGNPFAALAAALTLLVPLLAALDGRVQGAGRRVAVTGGVAAHPADTRLVPVRVSARGAVPVGHDRPGSLWGAALADALAAIPPGWDGGPVELVALP